MQKGKVIILFQLRWIWKNLKGYRVSYIIALCLVLVGASLTMLNPIISQHLVDQVIVGTTDAAGNVVRHKEMLIPLCLALVFAMLTKTIVFYIVIMLCERASQGVVHTLRDYLYQNMQKQDMGFYDKNRTGDLMTRLTGDMDMIRHTVAWIVRVIIENVFLFIATTVYFLTVDIVFTLVLLAITPLIYFVTKKFSRTVRPLYVDLREKLSNLNTSAQENISGNRVVRAFAREDFENQKFDEKNTEYMKASLKSTFTWLRFFPAIESLAQSLTVVTLLIGGYFIIIGRLSLGELLAFSSLSWTLANPMRMMGMLLNDLQRFFASSSKVIELYYSHPTIVNRYDCVTSDQRFKGKVEFKNVSLKFNEGEILKNISFCVEPGETVAIMGNTGSGKTLLTNLIPRLYDATDGEVVVDGVDVRFWDKASLRKNIGMATQDVFLFSDTVDGNIAYGDSSVTEDETKQFAHLASADFIYKMEDGFDTLIGERGVGLSGGQKQRIALARALAIRPSILILDDTTSAVDLETEKFIQQSLKGLDFSCTKFIIAQRTSTTKNADKIIILHDGEIVECGTHDELLSNNGFYSEIYALQNDDCTSTLCS
ncbi:MAG: transporter ATP-binding protein [Oscillospiraceae bacterium]|nr:transporter ATP-binding protein [Oscillospiraceae bacterium]